MATSRRGRKTLREQLEDSHRASSYYAAMAGKPPPEKHPLLEKPKRTNAKPGANGKPLERDILKAVIQALRYDKRVARVERNQSGVFQDGNRYIRVGSKGKLDLTVYLKDGRYLEIEVKRERHISSLSTHQLERIRRIQADGGLAGWCWSPESAIALLPT